MHIFMHRLFAL